MLRRFPRIRQHDVADCGAACLLSITRYHRGNASLARIRQLASTDRAGTNVLGLVEAATALGFAAKGVRAAADALPRVPLPAIAHLKLKSGLLHYVVLQRATGRHVTVMDPADGEIKRIPVDDFAAEWTGTLVLVVPEQRVASGGGPRPLALRFLELVRPHRTVLLQALVGAVAYTVLGLSVAVYVRVIVDHVIVDGNRNLLNLLGVGMLAMLALQVYFGSVKSMLGLHTAQRIDATLLMAYYRHLLHLPQRFFDTMRAGEIISRVGDAVKIRAFVNDVAVELAVHGLVVLFSLAVMLAYNWRLALVVGLSLPLYGVVLQVGNAVNRRVLRRTMERAADLESQLVECVGSIGTIKRFGLERHTTGKLERRLVRLLRPVFGSGCASIFTAQGTELISRLSVIVLFWVGTGFVIANRMTPGELMSFYALLGYLTGPATRLVGANRTIQDALIAADRLFEIMDLERENPRGAEDGGTRDPGRLPVGEIRFEEVTFRYGNRHPVLRDLDLVLPRGRITALVGPSGGGKTTIASLLQRLYPLEAGAIRIGGTDLRDIDLSRLRAAIASVPQQVDLFAGSVLENIAVGEDAPDAGRVREICLELGIAEFIESLPHRYGTQLGEHGVALSGGQRQRIAIARALYREPEVLILDEATSHLDSLSERKVQDCLLRLRTKGLTIILIAHRLATVARADRVIVLDQGEAVEQGTHRELLAAGGRYATLWRDQYPRVERFEEGDAEVPAGMGGRAAAVGG